MHKVVGSDAGSKYHFRTAALTTAYLARFLVDLSSEALVEGHCERQVYEVAGAQRRTRRQRLMRALIHYVVGGDAIVPTTPLQRC